MGLADFFAVVEPPAAVAVCPVEHHVFIATCSYSSHASVHDVWLLEGPGKSGKLFLARAVRSKCSVNAACILLICEVQDAGPSQGPLRVACLPALHDMPLSRVCEA